MYFKDFPNIYYIYNVNGEEVLKIVKDVTQNIRIRKEILENITLYDEYDIGEGETPEIISNMVYGSPYYHWVIMLANQIYNHVEDWPKSYHQLEDYIKAKYETTEQIYATHHWEKDGFVVNSDAEGAYPVSNYQYEEAVNEQKRRIKIVSPDLLNKILAEFRDLI